jgi:hypothetical protein
MNARSIILIGAVVLLGAGLVMTLLQQLQPPPPANRVNTAVAAQPIEPYTVVTEAMVGAGESVRESYAADNAIWPADQVIGKMSTKRIAPGETLSEQNLKPIEQVRFVEDLNLELVSFAASVDRLMGGELRPGHIINLYGFTQAGAQESVTELIEPRLWVVKVSSSGQPVSEATPQYNPDTAKMEYPGSDADRPATLVTVATTPDKAYKIIDALGAKRMTAWVTLAANQSATAALATPIVAAPTATPGLSLELSLTATAIAESLRATQPPPPPKTGGGGSR